ncbi:SMP-30/gluconolactonase/LRE family protein [Acetobacter thailandicus]|uniref:SMP-30/gluconolactonase/LRE family protein n=1 Tax=Acetobacter thailandicus TaxID=1502842 RepID=UPI001BA4C471|nr:SMP-30/gluconolactonase/LRE family protein [Acetobacter thailandicus]MBS0986104.1 SMP-30/gluconolactonase/LRE family protein [Acetobacter thailandicus]
MPHLNDKQHLPACTTRRKILAAGIAGLAGTTLIKQHDALAANNESVSPPSVISTPARVWGPQAPVPFTPDPDIISYDPSFNKVISWNAPLEQAWRGNVSWLEGPAWSVEGRFLLVSDVTGSSQYRYAEDTHAMSVFRKESYHSNGNTFDNEGRLLTCEHGLRRVIRWEHNGTCTVLADKYQGKRLNSPNDIVVDKDGGIWFTDPDYGDRLWEGHPNEPGINAPTPDNLTWNLGTELSTELGGAYGQQAHVFYIDPETRELTAVLTENQLAGPNGLCFSPDYKTLYIASSADKAAHPGGGGFRNIYAFDVTGNKLTNQRTFASMTLNGEKLMPDGIKADVMGNIWVGASGSLGLCGVIIYNPAGKMIGRLRMPRTISNLTFGGPERNRLFMTARDSIFTLDVATQGAGLS